MIDFLEPFGANFLAGHDGSGERVLVQMRKAQGIKYWKPVAETNKHQSEHMATLLPILEATSMMLSPMCLSIWHTLHMRTRRTRILYTNRVVSVCMPATALPVGITDFKSYPESHFC